MPRRAKEKFVDNPYHPSNGWYAKDEEDCRRMEAKCRAMLAANDNDPISAVITRYGTPNKKAA